MKKSIFIFCLVFVFTLTACSSKAKPKEPVTNETTSPSIAEDETQATKIPDPPASSPENQTPVEPENPDYVYQPERALPDGLPVFPGAVLTYDTQVWAAEGTAWMWMYEEAGSANEIVEFFKTELEKLGFEIDKAFADREEFHVADKTGTVSLGYSADQEEDMNQLGYMITVNLDAWDKR